MCVPGATLPAYLYMLAVDEISEFILGDSEFAAAHHIYHKSS